LGRDQWTEHVSPAEPSVSAKPEKKRQSFREKQRLREEARLERRRAAGKPDAKLSLGFTSIKLYEDRIESPWGSGSLAGVRAHIDSRGYRGQKTYVVIEGPHLAIAQRVPSNSGAVRQAAEKFVAKVNSAALRLGEAAPESDGSSDAIDQLERLGKLRDSGVITSDEFEVKKAELLGRL